MSFKPSITDTYDIFVPAFPDGIVMPSNTAYRQSKTVTLRKMTVTAVPKITSIAKPGGLYIGVHGTAMPTANRKAAKIQVQIKLGATWTNRGAPVAVANGATTWAKLTTVPKKGTWSIRVQYADPGVVLKSHVLTSRVGHGLVASLPRYRRLRLSRPRVEPDPDGNRGGSTPC